MPEFILNSDEDGEIVFITLDDIFYFHDLALIEGGKHGDLKTDDLIGALGRPQNYYLYEQEDDLVRLAAILWHGISQAHGFADGNKRTALLSAIAFLAANGLEIDKRAESWNPGVLVDELYKKHAFCVDVLDHYLRTHCRWIVS